MNKAEVSSVSPVFQVEKYLEKCLDSVLGQTFQDWEAILVDDGSTDSSGMICDSYAKKDFRFKVIHKSNGGLSSARNAGSALACGAFIFFLDSDDWLEANAIDELVAFQRKTQATTVIGNYYYTYDNKDVVNLKCFKHEVELAGCDAIKSLLFDKVPGFAWGKLIKREVVQKYDFPMGKYYEDTFWTHRILDAGKVVFTPRPYIHYLQRPDSISYFNVVRLMDRLEGFEERLFFLNSHHPELLDMYKKRVKKILMAIFYSVYFHVEKTNRTNIQMTFHDFIKNHLLNCDFSSYEKLYFYCISVCPWWCYPLYNSRKIYLTLKNKCGQFILKGKA